MSNERLEELMILYCERDMTDNFDISELARLWVTAKLRRITFKI